MTTPQLCHPYDDKPLKFPILVEPKYDGFRALCINGVFYSRLGKKLYNVNELGDLIGTRGEWVFDGELVSKDWNQTASVLHTQSRVVLKATYHVFDMLPLHEWSAKLGTVPLIVRRNYLEMAMKDYVYEYLQIAPSTLVKDWESVQTLYGQYLAQGYEGVVIKDPSSKYMFRRHKSWMKIKPHKSDEFRIVSVIEGTGKYIGMLGAVMVDVDGYRCGVGTGFDDAQRRQLWENPPINKHIEVRFQERTSGGVLRFPSFMRFRPDKDF